MSSTKVAVVTGSSSGIGRDTAIALSKAGWSLVLSGRRQAELEATASSCTGETLIVSGDVSKEASVKDLFEQTEKKFGRVDLLFNNAGVSFASGELAELDMEKFEMTISINLTGSVLCAKYAAALMKKQSPQGGRIINNGSISAYAPRPDSIPYTVSKHAISGLTKCIALDGRKYGISCSQIDIGNAATAMGSTSSQGMGARQADGSMKQEPTFDSQEVANAIVYMGGLPKGTNALNLTIMASDMPFVGRG